MAKKEQTAMVVFNSGPAAETVKEVRAAVMDILKSGAEQETLRKALDVVHEAAKSAPISITGCNFTTGDKSNG